MDGTTVADLRRIELTPDEFELVRMALRVLLSTLGKEEADELREVEALLEKLDR